VAFRPPFRIYFKDDDYSPLVSPPCIFSFSALRASRSPKVDFSLC